MSDLKNASTFFLIFAGVLLLYGIALAKTGNVELMPIQTVHSIRGPEDVKRAGRIVVIVGLVIGALSLVLMLVAP